MSEYKVESYEDSQHWFKVTIDGRKAVGDITNKPSADFWAEILNNETATLRQQLADAQVKAEQAQATAKELVGESEAELLSVKIKLTQAQTETARLKFLLATIRNRCQSDTKSLVGYVLASDILKTLREELPELMQLPVTEAPATPKGERVLIERGSIFQSPKFSTGGNVLYYGKSFTVLSTELLNGVYAYQLQDTDGNVIGAMIAESELEPYTEAPAANEVTLTTQEIEWCARHYRHHSFRLYHSEETSEFPKCLRYLQSNSVWIDLHLHEKYKTEANYTAIAARRKELGLGE